MRSDGTSFTGTSCPFRRQRRKAARPITENMQKSSAKDLLDLMREPPDGRASAIPSLIVPGGNCQYGERTGFDARRLYERHRGWYRHSPAKADQVASLKEIADYEKGRAAPTSFTRITAGVWSFGARKTNPKARRFKENMHKPHLPSMRPSHKYSERR